MPTSIELLRNTLTDWCLLSGKKDLTEPEIESWVKLFGKVHPKILVLALAKATEGMHYMPKPGHLSDAIAAAKAELCWKDRPHLVYREGIDAKGVKCVYWSDEPNVPAYRAVDCPEGRKFLAQLANIAGVPREKAAEMFEKYSKQAADLA